MSLSTDSDTAFDKDGESAVPHRKYIIETQPFFLRKKELNGNNVIYLSE